MRGNPILRAIALLVAMCLIGVLVAAVLKQNPSPEEAPPSPTPAPASTSLIPTVLTLTLSAPAKSITFTEPSGRLIQIPTEEGLEIEHETELNLSNSSWSAGLSISWEDPTKHSFLRLEFEPEDLKNARLLLDFPGDVSDHPLEANFDPSAQ